MGQGKGDLGSEATAQTGGVRALGGSGPHLHSPWEALGCWPTAWPSWSESHSCMRIKGSRPFCVSLLHGFGRDSMSLTLPCDRPSTWGWAGREGWVSRSWPSPPPLLPRPSGPLLTPVLRGEGCLHVIFTLRMPVCVPVLCPPPAVPFQTALQAMEFSRPEHWSGWFPSPGGLPNPGIEPRSPALRADYLPAEPQGKPI